MNTTTSTAKWDQADYIARKEQLEAEAAALEKALRDAGKPLLPRPKANAQDPDLIAETEALEAHVAALKVALRFTPPTASKAAEPTRAKPGAAKAALITREEASRMTPTELCVAVKGGRRLEPAPKHTGLTAQCATRK
jgi:hypothetical protein